MLGLFDSNGRPMFSATSPSGRESSLGTVPGNLHMVQVKFTTTAPAQDILQLANVKAALGWYVPSALLNALLAGPGVLAQVEVIFDATTQLNVNGLGYQDLVSSSIWESVYMDYFKTLVAKDASSGVLRVMVGAQVDPNAAPNVSV